MRIGNLTHTWVGDLKLELTSPAGTIVVLANRPGGTANSANNFTGTVFDDEASVAIGAGGTAAPYTGSFRPQADQLSRFDGETQQGTWTLKVSDLARADTGSLNAWGLDLAAGTCDFDPPPAPGQPTGLVATAGADSVALDWNDTAAATDYEIYRRGPGGAYPTNPTATATSSAFADPGRTPGQEYCYKVGALNDASPGPLSEERCATPPLAGRAARRLPADPRPRPSRWICRDCRARSVSARAGIFVLRFLATPGQAGSLKITTVKAVAAARKRKTGGGPEAVHGPRQRARTTEGPAGQEGPAGAEASPAAPGVREGHARDPHGLSPGHAARPAAAALSRVPSA